MELRTYNQILNLFTEFADKHPQINSYDVGTELQIDLKKSEDYPKMFILIGPATLDNHVASSFTIDVLDIPATKNQKIYNNEILSDTFQIASDIIAYLKQLGIITQGTTITLNPLYYQQDGVLTGWQFNIDISTEFIVQSCFVEGYTPI